MAALKYWIDTDPGIDDALALVLAISEVPDAILGISTVQGNVEEAEAARNLQRVLATCGREGMLPSGWAPEIVRGSAHPLMRDLVTRAYEFHGRDGLGGVTWPAGERRPESAAFAPLAIAEAARRHRDGLWLVFLGPLTNLALALHAEPALPELVAGATVMGGSLRAGGNDSMAAEFNFLADALAAREVLAAGFRELRLVPLDGCDEARAGAGDLERVAGIGTPAGAMASELLAFWAPRIRERGAGLYDPTAWMLTTRPDLAAWTDVYVTVDIGRDVAHGASVSDWRGRFSSGPNVRAALRLDREGVMDRFCELLEGR